MTKVTFDTALIDATDRYKLMSGLIVPRPIGWVGTRSREGTNNLAPFSFFNAVSSNPPVVLFSGGSHGDRPKDSVTIAEDRGEFTVNIVSEELAQAMSLTSGTFDAVEDEFAIAGLTAMPATRVDAPMVAESPANLECRVRHVIALGDRTRLVVGDVLAIHVEEDVLDGTRIDNDVLRAIGRMAGATYINTRDRFEIERPG